MNKKIKKIIDIENYADLCASEHKSQDINTDVSASSEKIMIYGIIGAYSDVKPTFIISQIDAAEADNKESINIHINSPGGSAFDAVSIYNRLVESKLKVNVFIDSLAASAASFIAMAGDSIKMYKNSMFMIHQARAGVYGTSKSMLKMSSLLNKVDKNIIDIYAEKTGKSVKKISELMSEETWFSTSEAIEFGLADSVIEDDSDTADAENKSNEISNKDIEVEEKKKFDLDATLEANRIYVKKLYLTTL